MNNAKSLKKSLLFVTLGILAFSIIPAASAGYPGFLRRGYYPASNNIIWPFMTGNYSLEFSASENLYFFLGWVTTDQEIENDWCPKQPWQMKLFINNEEINLQRFGRCGLYNDIWVKFSYWYHIFGSEYFTAGEEYLYLLRWEFWVQKPYQGDGKNYWRIFVDYWGIYGPPGAELVAEYYLNIVA